MIRTLTLLLTGLLTLPALADQWSVGAVASHHRSDREAREPGFRYNERHLLIGYQRASDCLYGAAILNNSYGDPALTVGCRSLTPLAWLPHWQAEVYVGLVAGYRQGAIDAGLDPLRLYGWAGLSRALPVPGWRLAVRGVPRVWTLGLYYSFDH